MQYAHRDLVGRDPFERADDRLDRALHVALDDDRQFLGGAGRDLREHLLERAAPAGRRRRVAPAALAEIGDLARPALVLDDDEIVAGERQAVETRAPRSGSRVRPPPGTGRARRPARAPGPIRRRRRRCRRYRSVPRCTRTVATGPRPRSSLASSTTPSAVRSGFAFRSSSSACSRIASCKLVEIGLFQRRHLDVEHLAAELLDDDLVLQQFLADPVGSARRAGPSC